MTTRSRSVAAESLQRALDEVQTPARTGPSVHNTTTTDSLLLLTPLEQKFILLDECSKDAYLLWIPSFRNYTNQGGSRSLPSCMDPFIQIFLNLVNLLHYNNFWIHHLMIFTPTSMFSFNLQK